MSKTESPLQSLATQMLKTGNVEEQAKLLLLGAMMNKSLRLPYAVVKPRQQEVVKEKSDVKEASKTTGLIEGRGVKRKEIDISSSEPEVDRKEKRRKMNRVSAQNSRDKKKQYLTDLEERLKYLEEKNKELVQENKLLQERSSVLEEEKRELASRLASHWDGSSEQVSSQRKESGLEWTGSAVPTVSLQQKPTPASLLHLWMSVSLICWLACVKNWQHQSHPHHSLPSSPVDQLHHHHCSPHQNHLHRVAMWWGAQQASWNPPMN